MAKGQLTKLYLDQMMEWGTVVDIYLTNGTCLTGKIDNHDDDSIFLEWKPKKEGKQKQRLINKAHVLTIQPQHLSSAKPIPSKRKKQEQLKLSLKKELSEK